MRPTYAVPARLASGLFPADARLRAFAVPDCLQELVRAVRGVPCRNQVQDRACAMVRLRLPWA